MEEDGSDFKKTNKEEYDKIFNTLFYFHPYFIYHIESQHYYNTDHYWQEQKFHPYSIPKYTIDCNESSIYPKDNDESSVQRGLVGLYINLH